jgi:hypothetical protein
MTLLFFLIASAFSFLVGIGLAVRSRRAMRWFDVTGIRHAEARGCWI